MPTKMGWLSWLFFEEPRLIYRDHVLARVAVLFVTFAVPVSPWPPLPLFGFGSRCVCWGGTALSAPVWHLPLLLGAAGIVKTKSQCLLTASPHSWAFRSIAPKHQKIIMFGSNFTVFLWRSWMHVVYAGADFEGNQDKVKWQLKVMTRIH